MTQTKIISGISDIAPQYGAIFCDAWGVIHNGRELFDGVIEALTSFRKNHGPVIIITNAPRLSDVIPPQLDRLGLPKDAYDRVVTSGDATVAAIKARSGDGVFRLGPNKDDSLFTALDMTFAPLESADSILCTGFFDDQTETPEDYRDMLAPAAARGLPMICANPDKVVKFGDRIIYCAGSLGDLYEELGGTVIQCGKPNPPIYSLCRDILSDLDRSSAKILAIGDGVHTDILGANQERLDVAFVADGIFSADARDDTGQLNAQRLSTLLQKHGVHAEYALDSLRW